MKRIAAEWVRGFTAVQLTAYNDPANQATSFKTLFIDKFCTTQQKTIWQQQFFNLKQRSDSVDAYIAKFKNLNQKYAMPVQAAGLDNIDIIINAARNWETGKHITASETDTKEAIARLTDQIAQLSFKLV
ncbi:3944_t:CDS:2 [Dentiscutata heterogama]|uniref:3944_t:CDS:1 n=1 Tax=Dentiscutata heterogama TaxID=1316150 RepID=A0ACA9NAQ1_9GLOM|nr:3944_t:CDS:2 [Dentiscutata heterogama]